jgi:hypothetical protein
MALSYIQYQQELTSSGGANAQMSLDFVPSGTVALFWPDQIQPQSSFSVYSHNGAATVTLGFATNDGDTGTAVYSTAVENGDVPGWFEAAVQAALTSQGFTESLAAALATGGQSALAIAAATVSALRGAVPVYVSPPAGLMTGFERDPVSGKPIFRVAAGETDVSAQLPCRASVNLTGATSVSILLVDEEGNQTSIAAEAVAPVSPTTIWAIKSTAWPSDLSAGQYVMRGWATATADGSTKAATADMILEVR